MTGARRVLYGVLGLAVLLVAAIPFAMPQAAAYACPSCYGFERVGDGLYVEADRPHPDLAQIIEASRARVKEAFDIETVPPVALLACDTAECDRRLGGRGAKARAYGDKFILVAPEGRTKTIISHEFAHIVMHERLGSIGLLRGDLPAWKNEGIAVLVSGDTRYFAIQDGTYGCTTEPDDPLPETASAWGKAMRPDTHLILYAQAACKVLRAYGPPPYDLRTLLQGHG